MSDALTTIFLPDTAPFGLEPSVKTAHLLPRLAALTAHHRERCPPYARLVDRSVPETIEEIPFVPVTVFKEFDLRSTLEPVMSVSSSATTTGTASRIVVDKETRKRQNLSAVKVLADFIGGDKRPYLVFDLEETVRGTQALSARGAAALSLAHLAREFHFVMRREGEALSVDEAALDRALAAVGDAPFVAYGFTHLLYQAHEALARRGWAWRAHPGSWFLHSGGWKRLAAVAVDKPAFNRAVAAPWGLAPDRVIDFYGMVEQVGVLYPDCPMGRKHVPYWADVIIRRADSLEPAAVGETGLIQLLNGLPLSAPNHSVLAEDLGELAALDGCECGRRGKAFVFKGRAPAAEVRGCSDVARY